MHKFESSIDAMIRLSYEVISKDSYKNDPKDFYQQLLENQICIMAWIQGVHESVKKPVAISPTALNSDKGKRTYKVAPQEQCASCTIAERCTLKGIPESEVFKFLNNDKLFTNIADGGECYCSAEVVLE